MAKTQKDFTGEETLLESFNVTNRTLNVGTNSVISKQYATGTVALANTLAPGVKFRLISIDLKIGVAGTTSESFTIIKDAGDGTAYDVLEYSINTLTGSTTGGTVTALHVTFGEGYEYEADDELDAAWTNTEGRTYGLVWTYQAI